MTEKVTIVYNEAASVRAVMIQGQKLKALAESLSHSQYRYEETMTTLAQAEFFFFGDDSRQTAAAFSLAARELAERYRYRVIGYVLG